MTIEECKKRKSFYYDYKKKIEELKNDYEGTEEETEIEVTFKLTVKELENLRLAFSRSWLIEFENIDSLKGSERNVI